MPAIKFRPRKEKRMLSGHPWIYQSEIGEIDQGILDGGTAEIRNHRGRFLGRGYVNRKSQIACRVLTYDDTPVDEALFKERIAQAVSFRKQVVRDTNACRLIYSESDRLPGIIVDRYDNVLVVQFMTLGMERWKEPILNVLTDIFQPAGIYERSDLPIRAHEGLPFVSQPLRGMCPNEVIIQEHGIKYIVDIVDGQKTGFFLDQRENRALLSTFTEGARVLDCFCHTGGFALAAASGGAKEVIGIDSSEAAIVMAERNAGQNGYTDRCNFLEGNVFDALRVYHEKREAFDAVVLDPPAFTRGKSSIPGAIRGYKDINLRAMRILNPGGYLLTCSCSYHMSEPMFRDVLTDAAQDAGRVVRIIENRTQPKDHPVLLAARETQYLKTVLLQVF
ncbi:MAG: class I SAM-dependent rRNA methyltransferase [Gemmatimonadota bacterium]|nr:class I SAM-dependent rRNA methyltransferase [Gemmatimonadota bacterium]